jgi:hypothetical protein
MHMQLMEHMVQNKNTALQNASTCLHLSMYA